MAGSAAKEDRLRRMVTHDGHVAASDKARQEHGIASGAQHEQQAGEDDWSACASALQVGSRDQLRALRCLIDEGRLDLAPGEDGMCLLGELLEHLAQPRRPDYSRFAEGEHSMPGDSERLAVVSKVDPRKGRCRNGMTPLTYALMNRVRPALAAFAHSPIPEVAERVRRQESIVCHALGWNGADRGEAEIQDEFEDLDDYQDMAADEQQIDNFSRAVDAVDQDRAAALACFTAATAGSGYEGDPEYIRLARAAGHLNLILMHKENLAQTGGNQARDQLAGAIRNAVDFVGALPAPLTQTEQDKAEVIWHYALDLWDHLLPDEQDQVFGQLQAQIKANRISLADAQPRLYSVLWPMLGDVEKQPLVEAFGAVLEAMAQRQSAGTGPIPEERLPARIISDWIKTGLRHCRETLEQSLERLAQRDIHDWACVLQYYELFCRVQDPRAKARVARTVFDRTHPEDGQSTTEISTDSGSRAIAGFALANMGMYYLLSPLHRPELLDQVDRMYGGFEDIPLALGRISDSLQLCGSEAQDALQAPGHDENRLARDLELESRAMQVDFGAQAVVDRLKKDASAATCARIDNWVRIYCLPVSALSGD